MRSGFHFMSGWDDKDWRASLKGSFKPTNKELKRFVTAVNHIQSVKPYAYILRSQAESL
jgi:hypothetical protein